MIMNGSVIIGKPGKLNAIEYAGKVYIFCLFPLINVGVGYDFVFEHGLR